MAPPPYNMAKSALQALAFSLAKEVREDGIRVNIVAPGLVETEMGKRLMQANTGIESLTHKCRSHAYASQKTWPTPWASLSQSKTPI